MTVADRNTPEQYWYKSDNKLTNILIRTMSDQKQCDLKDSKKRRKEVNYSEEKHQWNETLTHKLSVIQVSHPQ